MGKLSVLEIIGDSSLAGAPRHLLSILEKIDLEKFSPYVICPPGPLAGEIRDIHRHVDLEVVKMHSRMDLDAISKIRRQIKAISPDIIHVHGTRAGSLGRLAAIGLNIPVIYTEHLWTKQFKLPGRLMNFYHYFGNWFLDMFTNLNIAVSYSVKDFLVTTHISRQDKIKVIYNGIEPVESKANIFQKENEFKIATVATLNRQKGIQFLIQAMPKILNEYPKTTLEIIGNGPYKHDLEKLTKKMHLERSISFMGFIADVEKKLKEFDLYVQPSLSESFGLAIVQAMSVGLPIVATDAGGIPEVVTDGKSGLLVKAEDSKALSDAILEILRHPALAKNMGAMAKKEVELKFNLEDMIKELEKTYEATAEASSLVR